MPNPALKGSPATLCPTKDTLWCLHVGLLSWYPDCPTQHSRLIPDTLCPTQHSRGILDTLCLTQHSRDVPGTLQSYLVLSGLTWDPIVLFTAFPGPIWHPVPAWDTPQTLLVSDAFIRVPPTYLALYLLTDMYGFIQIPDPVNLFAPLLRQLIHQWASTSPVLYCKISSRCTLIPCTQLLWFLTKECMALIYKCVTHLLGYPFLSHICMIHKIPLLPIAHIPTLVFLR